MDMLKRSVGRDTSQKLKGVPPGTSFKKVAADVISVEGASLKVFWNVEDHDRTFAMAFNVKLRILVYLKW